MRIQYLIGVDIGTQGTKAVLFDTEMRTAAQSFEASRLISPAPGVTWQDPEEIYGSVVRTIRDLMARSGVAARDVLALGIDSQMAGILGVGADGEAVTCYDSWLDVRCAAQVEEMRRRAGKRVTELTGGPVTYTHGPKILWWKQEHPEAYARTEKFVLPHAYVVGKLAGLSGREAYFDYTGMQYSGFGDNEKKEWSEELLDLFGVDSQKMARIVSPFEIIGELTAEAARACSLAEGTPIVAGAGDTAASIFGTGLFEGGELLDCAGTASVLCGSVERYAPDTVQETLTMMRSPVDGVWFPLAYINGGGLCLRWFRDTLNGSPAPSYAELEECAAQIEPGSDGVVFVPHFAGRVLPSNPSLRGSFTGLAWTHSRGHLFHAVLEGIAYEYRFYLNALHSLFPEYRFDKMLAVGGGARSRLFLSVKADVLGVEAVPYETPDTAPLGSAVIAGVGAGVFSDYRAPILGGLRAGEPIRPSKERHLQYQKPFEVYMQTLGALSGVYQKQQNLGRNIE